MRQVHQIVGRKRIQMPKNKIFVLIIVNTVQFFYA